MYKADKAAFMTSTSLFSQGGPPPNPPTERKIGRGIAVLPEHKPTKAVPDSLLVPATKASRERSEKKARTLVESLRPGLGEPFLAREGLILYHADCRVVLEEIRRVGIQVDLTLTSPPYNIGKEYERPLDLDEYLAWVEAWLRDLHSVTARKGSLWLNLGYVPVKQRGRAVPLPYLLWNKSPFFLQQEVVWNYGAGVTAKRMFCPRNEKWMFYTRDEHEYTFNLDLVRDPNVKYPNQKKNGKFRCNPLGKNPSDVWQIPKVTTGANRSSRERTSHPAQFPLELVDRIVKVSSNPGDVLLDPFCGSGSAGIAAIGNGCIFLGAELRADYCAMVEARLDSFIRLRKSATAQVL